MSKWLRSIRFHLRNFWSNGFYGTTPPDRLDGDGWVWRLVFLWLLVLLGLLSARTLWGAEHPRMEPNERSIVSEEPSEPSTSSGQTIDGLFKRLTGQLEGSLEQSQKLEKSVTSLNERLQASQEESRMLSQQLDSLRMLGEEREKLLEESQTSLSKLTKQLRRDRILFGGGGAALGFLLALLLI